MARVYVSIYKVRGREGGSRFLRNVSNKIYKNKRCHSTDYHNINVQRRITSSSPVFSSSCFVLVTPTPIRAKVEDRVELYFYLLPIWTLWPVLG